MLARSILRAASDIGSATWSRFDPEFWGSGRKFAGVTINEETALNVSTAFACTRVISATGSSLPLKVYKKRSEGRGSDVVSDHKLSRIISQTSGPRKGSSTSSRAGSSTIVGSFVACDGS